MATEDQVKESIAIRGVCATIQSMAMPTVKNLVDLLEKAGFSAKIEKKKI